MPDRVATYRWQLTPETGFDAAASAVPDLAALGVSHLYLSPVAEAVPGSTHGYDVTDPLRLRHELGGASGFSRLTDACRDAGLRLLIDVVPNHVAAHEANPWWWDVLRRGAASPYALVLDVDWSSTDPLLLPVLGDHYGRELEAGHFALERRNGPGGVAVVRAFERTFPLRPETEGALLAAVARAVDDDVLGVAARLLARSESSGGDAAEREADLAVAQRTVQSCLADPRVVGALDAELDAIGSDPERLDLVLTHQHYRLARWTIGDAELGYRRFFDVDALAATRMDNPETFELLHRLPVELTADDVVDGLRIDHVDGLADPTAYLRLLREHVGPDTWLLVEKIVRADEPLPPWPVAGTTGYEVADLLGRWLTDPAGARVMREGWVTRTGEARGYEEVALDARRAVLAGGFAADLDRTVAALQAVCAGRRRHRDHSRAELHAAVVEFAVATPQYRTYVVVASDAEESATAGERDLAVIARTLDRARAAAGPDTDPELMDFLAGILSGRYAGEAEARFVTRFQQLTGPLAAKGEEDTALYRWLPLPHRCEVGADPSLATLTGDDWHESCALAQCEWPERMTTLSTHDTKRSADARARLAALTATAAETLDAFDRWWRAVCDPSDGGVDPGTAWLVFHALVAAWPIDDERTWAAVRKSARESGLRTSWTKPDESFEERLHQLVGRSLSDVVARTTVLELVDATADAADTAALGQLLAQLLAPGVPDLYQGAEDWDRSLVDPDNRRPPDPERRARLVDAARITSPTEAWEDPALRRSGLPRTIVLRTALAARRRQAAAVGAGTEAGYEAIGTDGPGADRVLAFARGRPPRLCVVVARPGAPRIPDAGVSLPPGAWTNLFTGQRHDGDVGLADLTADFPVALLER